MIFCKHILVFCRLVLSDCTERGGSNCLLNGPKRPAALDARSVAGSKAAAAAPVDMVLRQSRTAGA